MLTGDERKAVRMAGELYTHIRDNVCGNGSARDDDLAELRASIHHVQRLVMAQAAGRLYPGEFRLMGDVVGGDPECAREEAAVPAEWHGETELGHG